MDGGVASARITFETPSFIQTALLHQYTYEDTIKYLTEGKIADNDGSVVKVLRTTQHMYQFAYTDEFTFTPTTLYGDAVENLSSYMDESTFAVLIALVLDLPCPRTPEVKDAVMNLCKSALMTLVKYGSECMNTVKASFDGLFGYIDAVKSLDEARYLYRSVDSDKDKVAFVVWFMNKFVIVNNYSTEGLDACPNYIRIEY